MQATAINNLKKAKGVDLSRESTPQGSGKGDLLQVMEVFLLFPHYRVDIFVVYFLNNMKYIASSLMYTNPQFCIVYVFQVVSSLTG